MTISSSKTELEAIKMVNLARIPKVFAKVLEVAAVTAVCKEL
jgi:hypothetical protein